jgi:hypothetical protein
LFYRPSFAREEAQTHEVLAVVSGKERLLVRVHQTNSRMIEDCYQRSKLETAEASAGGKPDPQSGCKIRMKEQTRKRLFMSSVEAAGY